MCGSSSAAASQVTEPQPAQPAAPTKMEEKSRMEQLAHKIPSAQRGLYNAGALAEHGVQLQETEHQISSVRVFRVPRLEDHVDGGVGPGRANRCVRTRLGEDRTHTRAAQAQSEDRGGSGCDFVSDEQVILADIVRLGSDGGRAHGLRAFVRGGMRERLAWEEGEVKAAVVTCGGLCPGLNNVVAEVVSTLYYHYGVSEVYGIRMGMRGFTDPEYQPWRLLHPEDIKGAVHEGGTFLGSSRGGFDAPAIVAALEQKGVNQVYVIGGDGTHRAANKLAQEVARRGVKISVATVPKTIDNDCGVIDSSFGFNTCIGESVKAIRSARVEADCTPNGIGIVKLMGRDSGFIAAHATLASREVDLCLVPEVPVVLDGPRGVLAFLEECVRARGRAVIVVAEGAGANLFKDELGRDESGNRVLADIGALLKERVKAHFARVGRPASIKYHDPSYMIRSVPANATDAIYCSILAQNAVHGAMAGFTGFTSAVVNHRSVFLPISLVTATSPAHLNPVGRTWDRVLSTTHQPCFHETRE